MYHAVGDRRLVLSVEQNACWLIDEKPDSKPLRLLVPPPCDFHRDLRGAVRVLAARDKSVALVQSSTASADNPADCVTVVQGVAVGAGSVRVAAQSSRVAACPPFQWDDVMFLGPFEEP